MIARLRVVSAGPLVTYQDAGRPGHMRFGIPASGPMDRLAHAAANVAVGNSSGATAVEVSVGGVGLEVVEGAVSIAAAGGDFIVESNASVVPHWRVLTLRSGDQVRLRSGDAGSWAYLAVAGRLRAESWLDHTATHSLSGLGGGALAAGDLITVDGAEVRTEREGAIPRHQAAAQKTAVRVVLGPQTHHFDESSATTFTSAAYVLSSHYDRMGVRLEGPELTLASALSIPSQPIVRGSIQVDGSGMPSLLFADHQTTGGYPKIATVISADLDRCAQLRPGDPIRFVAVEPSEAVTATRAYASELGEYLQTVAGPGRTLDHRLASENLIGGVQG